MKIALFDYIVTPDNAIGKCDLAILTALCDAHEFTVFSAHFENPRPGKIHWIRVPAPQRPMVALYVVFPLLAPLWYVWHCVRHRMRFDVVQVIESNLLFGDIAYSHFCHRTFLERHWKGIGAHGLRGALRWLDHRLRALFEPWVYRRVARIVPGTDAGISAGGRQDSGSCESCRSQRPSAASNVRPECVPRKSGMDI